MYSTISAAWGSRFRWGWWARTWSKTAILGLLCFGGSAGAQSLDHVTLQLKWRHQFQFAGYYAAIEQGYYREVGLEVILREAVRGEEPADFVLKGGAEFGVAASDLVLLHDQGEPVVVLAPILQHSPLVLLVKANTGITSIHDLAGKRLMLEPHAEELLAYLEFEDITRDEFEVVPHTFSPSPLIDGEVAAMSAYVTDELFLMKQSGMSFLTFTPRSTGIDFYGDTLFTTLDQVENYPDRVANFREASLRGWRYALDHPDEMVELIYDKYSQRHSREHLRFEADKFRSLMLPDVVDVGYQSPGRWKHIAEIYHRMGMVGDDWNLEDFIYEEIVAKPDLSRFHRMLVGAGVLIGLMVFVIVILIRMTRRIQQQADSLREALSEIKELRGYIPICAGCKKIRDDKGYWEQVETYLRAHTRAEFTHGICGDCARKAYPDYIPPIEK
jgi:two-component system sensor histidine kinase/response regulator